MNKSTPSPLSSSATALQDSTTTDKPRVPAILFGVTIVLSAFLLFQVQPLIAKQILPWFGGSAAVWTSCMLFFQIALLAGYAWAHFLSEQPLKRQIAFHVSLLLVSLAVLLFFPPYAGSPPVATIRCSVFSGCSQPPSACLTFCSPPPVRFCNPGTPGANGGAMPYRFFALSNAGSMAGLLTYPVFVEPNLTNRHQAWMWSGGFIAFAAFFIVVAWRSRSARDEEKTTAAADSGAAPTWSDKLLWIGLAACASALLLAVTNHMTQNVAAIPFLWVLPLSLYLLSFILCFDSDRWYRRGVFAKLAAVELGSMAYAMSEGGNFTNLKVAVAMLSVALFVFFMVCHGELARRRPASRYLTSFYLMVSVGGAIGGLLVGFIFPYVLPALIDLPIILSLTAFLFVWLLWRDYSARPKENNDAEEFLNEPRDKFFMIILVAAAFAFVAGRVAMSVWSGAPSLLAGAWDAPVLVLLAAVFVLYLLWRSRGIVDATAQKRDIMVTVLLAAATVLVMVLNSYGRFVILDDYPSALIPAGMLTVYLIWRSRDTFDNNSLVCFVAVGLAFGLTGYMARETWNNIGAARMLKRNFYGALVVYDEASAGDMGPVRVLRHGTINHGEQFLWPQNQRHATTYYAERSGLGLALRSLRVEGNINVGSIGLGAGTTAVYARPGDHYYFYDINPNVPIIATTQFSFLQHCYGKYQVILGDARLSLEDELKRGINRQFDLLSVDAFSGDAIPVHLLTREAYKVYWQHLKPDGVLAVHVSNLYLSLAPGVALAAAADGKQAMEINYEGADEREESSSEWVLVTSRKGFFDREEIKAAATKIDPIPGLREWTDDYSNLYKILR